MKDHKNLIIFFVCLYFAGRFTADISEYELLVPHKVDSNGDLISFLLPEFFIHNYESRRRKRDSSHPDIVHYKIFFNGNDHHIELWPNHAFVTSQTVNNIFAIKTNN